MALELAIQKSRLRDLLQSMYIEGIIDHQFFQLQALKESIGPDFVVRSVISYCVFVRNLFIDLTNHMSQVNINFYAVSLAAGSLFERTDSIGAVHVRFACAELLRASEANSPEELRGRLLSSKKDFEMKFDAFLKLISTSFGYDSNDAETSLFDVFTLSIVKTRAHENSCTVAHSPLGIHEGGLLHEYVQSLLDEGIVNDQFASVQTLKRTHEPDAIIRLITSYFTDVEAVLSELTRSIDSPEADFAHLAAQANTIKEKSLCVGAEHMKLACDNLICACEEKQGRKFSQALNWVKAEFAQTKDKLDAVVQMEKRILRLESERQK